MARSLGGLDLEMAIAGHLKNAGFRILEEEEWDHNNKIDFVVTKFPKYPKLVSIGVQITGRCDDPGKLSEFVARNDPKTGNVTVADKALYVEMEGNVDVNKGGADLVASLLYAFQFDDRFLDIRVWSARIEARADAITYRFYDPSKTASMNLAAAAAAPPLPSVVPDLKQAAGQLEKALRKDKAEVEGKFHSFFTDRGYGFIAAQDGSTYWVHIHDIQDAELKGDLDGRMNLPGKTWLNHLVIFEDGGKTRADAAYRTAKNVRLLLARTQKAS